MRAISEPKKKYNRTCMLGKGKLVREKVVTLAPGPCPALHPGVDLALHLLLHLVRPGLDREEQNFCASKSIQTNQTDK